MALANTLKTILGFFKTLIGRYTPISFESASLQGIFNFLPISETLVTAGQPTEKQFQYVKDAGFLRVINLAPEGAENALMDERGTLESLGMHYTHIPVDFSNPTEDDFKRFCAAMQELGDTQAMVHCAANMRVSAFVYRYRVEVLGEDPNKAIIDLHEIWEPFGVWKKFVKRRGVASRSS